MTVPGIRMHISDREAMHRYVNNLKHIKNKTS